MSTPIHYSDFYKTGHGPQYPKGTQYVYSNMTARASRMPGVNNIVVYGIQYFIWKYLFEEFNNKFFDQDDDVIILYKKRLDAALGPDSVSMDHIKALHKLGYLPIRIKALPEGTVCPVKVPFLTIENTLPEYFWLTNFLETLMSVVLWHPITVATIAFEYRKLLEKYAIKTSDMLSFVEWQGHDFSMRGQTSLESATVSGGGHLLSFLGTDTIPAIDMLEEYYDAFKDGGMVGGSVPATEHSVMCFGGETGERETFRRMITEVHPKGIVSIVSDTWDYWAVLTDILPSLKKEIMQRDGKTVIRPDSGDPVKIICGDDDAPVGSPAYLGTAVLLWETFGGIINSKGFKQLDMHIGMIYGDSITLERASQICMKLESMGFASTNIVFGIGSFTYQHVTRDTFGFAIKATAGMVNGKEIHVAKNPKTDNGIKKSAKGYLRVFSTPEGLMFQDGLTREESEEASLLQVVFDDGNIKKIQTLADIRKRLHANLPKTLRDLVID